MRNFSPNVRETTMLETKHSRSTQCSRLISYMQDFGSITQMETISELGIMRIASRISELKKEGYNIQKHMVKGKNRYGENVSWAAYSLQKEK